MMKMRMMEVGMSSSPECDLEEYKDLQARIEALRAELEGEDDDEEDEDDGGDIVVRV